MIGVARVLHPGHPVVVLCDGEAAVMSELERWTDARSRCVDLGRRIHGRHLSLTEPRNPIKSQGFDADRSTARREWTRGDNPIES